MSIDPSFPRTRSRKFLTAYGVLLTHSPKVEMNALRYRTSKRGPPSCAMFVRGRGRAGWGIDGVLVSVDLRRHEYPSTTSSIEPSAHTRNYRNLAKPVSKIWAGEFEMPVDSKTPRSSPFFGTNIRTRGRLPLRTSSPCKKIWGIGRYGAPPTRSGRPCSYRASSSPKAKKPLPLLEMLDAFEFAEGP
jgi:hypothetical protein